MSPLLSIEETCVEYLDRKTELRTRIEIEALEVMPGEIVQLHGPTGVGKSTLCHVIAGYLAPSRSTRLDVGGIDLLKAWRAPSLMNRFRKSVVAYATQQPALLPALTVREHLDLAMTLSGTPGDREERRERLLSALSRRGAGGEEDLARHGDTVVARVALSLGQQQRLALATNLATRVPVLVADEPTSNLDPDTAARVMDLIDELRRTEGLTVILVSHDPLALRRATVVVSLDVVEPGLTRVTGLQRRPDSPPSFAKGEPCPCSSD